jgi:hypothetical protein
MTFAKRALFAVVIGLAFAGTLTAQAAVGAGKGPDVALFHVDARFQQAAASLVSPDSDLGDVLPQFTPSSNGAGRFATASGAVSPNTMIDTSKIPYPVLPSIIGSLKKSGSQDYTNFAQAKYLDQAYKLSPRSCGRADRAPRSGTTSSPRSPRPRAHPSRSGLTRTRSATR